MKRKRFGGSINPPLNNSDRPLEGGTKSQVNDDEKETRQQLCTKRPSVFDNYINPLRTEPTFPTDLPIFSSPRYAFAVTLKRYGLNNVINEFRYDESSLTSSVRSKREIISSVRLCSRVSLHS